ncbi:copA [Symbiodinium microadriaticum]|nr:copA [Symbiodinium microadriaticum]
MAIDGAITGFFELSDQLRQEAASTIAALRTEGMKVWMVTGDHRRTADAIGKRVGLSSEYIVAGALPQVKLDFLVSRQNAGGRAVFVGDGINDAGALAQADVGIAMGGGTEVAIESADMVLMTANLTRVVTALSLSRSILRCIKRNLFWAIAYNVVAIPLAAGLSLLVFGSILPPWVAGGAMAMSSVSVVVSSLTLLRFRVDVNNE